MQGIRRATIADVPALGSVAPLAYQQAYGAWWTDPAALAKHAESFGAAAFVALLGDPAVSLWIAERDGAAVGFLAMHRDTTNPVTARVNGVELRRIYLLQDAMRTGLGRAMAEAAIDDARAEGYDHAWLDVMAQADWAVAAYRRWGFGDIGRIQFENALRGDRREMIVMLREID